MCEKIQHLALELKKPTTKYNPNFQLYEVNLRIKAGELTCIIGPNGAGKSTLLKSMSWAIDQDKSSFLIRREKVKPDRQLKYFEKDSRYLKKTDLAKEVAYLEQNPDLNFEFTAKQVVEFGAVHLGMNKSTSTDKVSQIMKDLSIESLAQRLYKHLSGGEKQRVHIARVLLQLSQASNGGILLLDEPSTGLDIRFQHQLFELLSGKHKEKTVIMVTHEINLILDYADRSILMDRGRVIADGKPQEVLTPLVLEKLYQSRFTYLVDEAGQQKSIISRPKQKSYV